MRAQRVGACGAAGTAAGTRQQEQLATRVLVARVTGFQVFSLLRLPPSIRALWVCTGGWTGSRL